MGNALQTPASAPSVAGDGASAASAVNRVSFSSLTPKARKNPNAALSQVEARYVKIDEAERRKMVNLITNVSCWALASQEGGGAKEDTSDYNEIRI